MLAFCLPLPVFLSNLFKLSQQPPNKYTTWWMLVFCLGTYDINDDVEVSLCLLWKEESCFESWQFWINCLKSSRKLNWP